MNVLEDAKKYLGQTRVWDMKYNLGKQNITCTRVSGHVSYSIKAEEPIHVTQVSIWCEYTAPRGEIRSVWFPIATFDAMEVLRD